jgi:recombinational DNA repair protein RecT
MATTAVQNAPVLVKDANVPALIKKSDVAQAYIVPLLPKGVTLEQVAAAQTRLALAQGHRPGALQKCTVGSVILAVAKICGWGLEIGTTAHLVPFGKSSARRSATTRADIELAVESGMVRRVSAQVVYANEPFKIIRGTSTLGRASPDRRTRRSAAR